MGPYFGKSRTVLLSGVLFAMASPAWAQLSAYQTTPQTPGSNADLGQPNLAVGGGFGSANMFSPFTGYGLQQPPLLQFPGEQAPEASRAFGVTLGVGASEKWTDNVYLTSSGKKSDFITSADPTIDVSIDQRHLQGKLTYDLGYDKYASESRLDGFRQNGLGAFDAELVDKTLFLDARASVSEQAPNPSSAASAGFRTSATNAVRVYTMSVAPRFQQQLGDWAVAQVSVHHDETRNEDVSKISMPMPTANNTDPGDSLTNGGRVELRSGQAFTRLLWDYTGDASRNTGSHSVNKLMSHTLGAEYKLSSDWGLLAGAGDDYLDNSLSDLSKYRGVFYSGGLHWSPSPNTDIRFGVGRRYNTTTYTAVAEHHFGPMTVLRFSEDTGVTTDALAFQQALNDLQRDQNGNFVDPFSGLQANPSYSPFARSSAVYRERSSKLALLRNDGRNSLSLDVRVDERRLIGGNTSFDQNIVSTTGLGTTSTVLAGDLSWSHQMTPVMQTVATISPSQTLASADSGTKAKQFRANLGLNYSLSPTLLGAVSYQYLANLQPFDTRTVVTDGLQTFGNVRENMIFISLRKTF